jgi:NADPH:quinone reductase-like Zn-dependent oxidoreductase
MYILLESSRKMVSCLNVFLIMQVIAVCDTEDKAALLRERGAWAALTNVPKEIVKRCTEVTDGQGVRIVFEPLESNTLSSVLKWLVCHTLIR